MRFGSARATIVASFLAFVAACGSDASRPTGLVLTKQAASLNDCTPSTALAPNGGVQYGDSATLSWALATYCNSAHRIEVYDTLSGSLVWSIDYPGVYNVGGRNEYYYLYFTSPVVKGKYYKWRVRAYLYPDTTMVGPWSSYAVFGVAPSRPISSASIVSGHPRLSWGAATGASTYRIYRQLQNEGSATLWGTTSGFSFTDNATTVTGSPMGSPPSGNWAKYYVTSVSAAGIESSYYTAWWFTTSGKGPYT